MARIPDEALERLKREVSLARLIEAQGLKLIVQGKDLACRCPWHEGCGVAGSAGGGSHQLRTTSAVRNTSMARI